MPATRVCVGVDPGIPRTPVYPGQGSCFPGTSVSKLESVVLAVDGNLDYPTQTAVQLPPEGGKARLRGPSEVSCVFVTLRWRAQGAIILKFVRSSTEIIQITAPRAPL